MNSKLQIEDRPGGGTIFFFDLEFKAAHCGSLKELENNTINSILIIEDNHTNFEIISRMLKHFKIKTVANKNYQNAYKFGNECEAIMADYELIGKEGLEELTKIGKPIILMQNSNSNNIPYPTNAIVKPIVKPIKIHLLQLILNELNSNEPIPVKSTLHKEVPDNIFNQQIKVLIVEDNKINMLLSKTLIEKIFPKAVLYLAINGEEAVEIHDSKKPDIILMDIQMPIMNGYVATEIIRATDKNCVIIALTAGIIKDEEAYCRKIGMNDYIAKPVKREILEATLLKWAKTIRP